MIAELLDRMIETDMFTSAKRTVDTQRYTIMRCQEKYGDSIDANEIHLFLVGANAQTLTKEQQEFILGCKSEMHSAYREILFRLLEYAEFMRLGLSRDYDEFLNLLTSNSAFLTPFDRAKGKAG